MANPVKYVFCCVLSALLSIMMPAQDLPPLPKDPNITTGVLPNGISYYLAVNQVSKGLADFSLLQKGATDVERARTALASSPHFSTKTPCEFLSSKGIGYSEKGYVEVGPDATSFRFRDIPVFDEAAVDSTFMLIFDLARTWPGDQAIVVAGDIAPAKILEKIKVLSMTVASREKGEAPEPYKWEPSDTASFRFIPTPDSSAGFVTAMYEFPRTPQANMNTAQPVVSEMFAGEFGTILTNRLRKRLRDGKIPVSAINYVYSSSAAGSGNEHYTITLHTLGDSLKAVVKVLAATLSDLDSTGASFPEYKDAKDELLSNVVKTKVVSNGFYTDQCASSFLYGSSLASLSTKASIFLSKNMEDSRELALYNNFVSALLDKSRNLTLQCVGSNLGAEDGQDLKDAFDEAWAAQWDKPWPETYRVNYSDTLGLVQPSKKAKIKRTDTDLVSGGEVLTFSNGVKVILKKGGSKNELNYALMVRGGYSSVAGLGRGEGAFVSDMLLLDKVAGMSGEDFRKMLTANGISMNSSVSLSDLRVFGGAPSSKLTLLMKALVSLANSRETDPDAFHYYKRNEALSEIVKNDGLGGISNAVDSLMFPGYNYSSQKDINSLRDDLPQRAEVYFRSQFSRVDDGVLVLVGDFDPVYVKKLLCKFVGEFRTTGGSFAARPKIEYQTPRGTVTRIVDMDDLPNVYEPSVTVSMSAQVPFSTDKYIAGRIADIIFRKAIIMNLADAGMYVADEFTYDTYPQERMSLSFTCRPADMNGLPSGMDPAGAVDVLEKVRAAIRSVASKPVSAAELQAYKSLCSNSMESMLSSPENLVQIVLMRYSEGKDLVGKYKERIAGITAAQVAEVLTSFAEGRRAEYVVR